MTAWGDALAAAIKGPEPAPVPQPDNVVQLRKRA